jgi:hypothetical protein
MNNNLLTSECPWCGEIYIKERIGVPHNCPQEKQPERHVIEAVEAVQESVTIYTKAFRQSGSGEG